MYLQKAALRDRNLFMLTKFAVRLRVSFYYKVPTRPVNIQTDPLSVKTIWVISSGTSEPVLLLYFVDQRKVTSFFFAPKHILKIGKCHAVSILPLYIQTKWYGNCYHFRHASSVGKSKVGSWQTQVNLLCLCICKIPVKYYRCSQLRLYHICFQDILLQKIPS